MKEMEPEQNETGEVYVIICRYFKKSMSRGIEIFRIARDQSKPDKIKIKKMKDKEGKY